MHTSKIRCDGLQNFLGFCGNWTGPKARWVFPFLDWSARRTNGSRISAPIAIAEVAGCPATLQLNSSGSRRDIFLAWIRQERRDMEILCSHMHMLGSPTNIGSQSTFCWWRRSEIKYFLYLNLQIQVVASELTKKLNTHSICKHSHHK
jgi:hypothetical protein